MLAHVLRENTAQRGTGTENGSESVVKWNGPFGPVQPKKWSTSRGGPIFWKIVWLDRTVPFSFRSKFPEILLE